MNNVYSLYILTAENMKNRVQKWGNSLAVRIPRSFAKALGWEENAPVTMSLEEGSLIIRTDRERAWDLGSLLGGITNENIHDAWEDEGSAMEEVDAATVRDDAGDG
jgi:antitoxin MazE